MRVVDATVDGEQLAPLGPLEAVTDTYHLFQDFVSVNCILSERKNIVSSLIDFSWEQHSGGLVGPFFAREKFLT